MQTNANSINTVPGDGNGTDAPTQTEAEKTAAEIASRTVTDVNGNECIQPKKLVDSLALPMEDRFYIGPIEDGFAASWYDARQWCLDHGMEIASINNADEWEFLRTWDCPQTGYCPSIGWVWWFGYEELNHSNPMLWKWDDGTCSTYENWYGTPTQKNHPTYCSYFGATAYDGQWLTQTCDYEMRFICRKY